MGIGFKEWHIVCEALGSGAQSIILRKGGIAEGREGFRFKHDDFFLFPTLFHEQVAKTTLAGAALPPPREDSIHITYAARVEWTMVLSDLSQAAKLAAFHVWRPEVVEERFRYEEAHGLSLAFLRVFRLDALFSFPDAPRYGGCRSWVEIPTPSAASRTPVLDDAVHAARSEEIRHLLASGT